MCKFKTETIEKLQANESIVFVIDNNTTGTTIDHYADMATYKKEDSGDKSDNIPHDFVGSWSELEQEFEKHEGQNWGLDPSLNLAFRFEEYVDGNLSV